MIQFFNRFCRCGIDPLTKTRATLISEEDFQFLENFKGRPFSTGTRPVIRWIKGDGLDDMVTQAAIGQATRLFGTDVDYCLCTQGIDAARVRNILEWAVQPVEWWAITEKDNPQVARFLTEAGCLIQNFGYWWKWFPERVRPAAPEWILDGDMVITGKPAWYKEWVEGNDVLRITQDDAEDSTIYGRYTDLVNLDLMLYSGLVSLPPNCVYMSVVADVMSKQPLSKGHNGKKDMCEQGVIAVTFQKLNAIPIPLYEFPFCRSFQDYIDFGLPGDQNRIWGYHFGNAFVRKNLHFDRLTDENIIFLKGESTLIEKFRWLGCKGQWGIPGWSMSDECLEVVLSHAVSFKGKTVLELGTSRGRLAAMLAELGCIVTTVDHCDRGAGINLEGLSVEIIIGDAIHFVGYSKMYFDLIICDLHGNSTREWKRYSRPLMKRVQGGSALILNNTMLSKIPEWHEESGVAWFLNQLPRTWKVTQYNDISPGIAFVTKDAKRRSNYLTNPLGASFSRILSLLHFVFSKRICQFTRRRLKLSQDLRTTRESGLFNEKYYLENNPDVRDAQFEPLRHYLLFGGFEGRNPSEKFNSAFYLEQYPDVKDSGLNPLVHFILFGQAEGRHPLS